MLQANEEAWTEEYLEWRATPVPRPAQPRRWAHADVKATLIAEAHGKCAYCESKVTHVYPGDAEHIEPKAHVPHRVVDWKNLTFACAECNRRKRDYFDPAEPLVHPYLDDPEQHIRFYGPQVFPVPGSNSGLRTVGKLELDRMELFDRRSDVVRRLVELLTLWIAEPPGLARQIRREVIESLAAQDAEYAAMIRCFLRATPEWDEESHVGDAGPLQEGNEAVAQPPPA